MNTKGISAFKFNRLYDAYNDIAPYAGDESKNIDHDSHELMCKEAEVHFRRGFKALRLQCDCTPLVSALYSKIRNRYEPLPVLTRMDAESAEIKKRRFSINAISNTDLMPFGSFTSEAKVFTIYKPDRYDAVITNYAFYMNELSRRIWDQQDLTDAIFDTTVKLLETQDVMVALLNLTHADRNLSTLKYKGIFTDEQYRSQFL